MNNVSFTERKTVQNPILKYAIAKGWEYVNPDEAIELRDGENGIFFRELFLQKLKEFNPLFSEDEIADVFRELAERVRYDISGNQKVLNYLRGQVPVYCKKKSQELNFKLIDFENIENNTFQVTDELSFTNGKVWDRFDLVFYINGLPIAVLEAKNPEKEEGLAEAFDQIKRYHEEVPNFLAYTPFFIISNFHEFSYGSTWCPEERYIYHWREGESFEEIINSFLDKRQVLSILEDYILFWEENEQQKKIILGSHQIRAVEKIVARVADGKKKHGLIWHTQGSGKSLTMIVAAHKLRKLALLKNPTLIIVVDRIELEEQMGRNLKNYGFPAVEVAASVSHLEELLKSDYRGLIVTIIHKFKRMPERVCERENVIIFVDEAHRTQEGEFGVYLRAALPNAFYFGFTGTPIDRTNIGKGTFITFGKDDAPSGYLDKYSILDSLKDGTTVQINYTLAPNELLVPSEIIEKEFFKMVEEEAITNVEDLDKKVLEKAVRLRTILKSKDRIAKVARFVAKHFRENVESMGFKAFLVGVDREACALLKTEIDKFLPQNYSEVIYTHDFKDNEFMRSFHKEENEEREIKKKFLKPEQLPKILIVTSKLLTGFDAPILYAMYLDKPMSDHTLLQAIARVNRPLAERSSNNPKTAGLIVDFIGLFGKMQKALKFDSASIEDVMVNLEKIKKEFAELMEKGKKYLEIIGEKIDDKAVERVIEYFGDKSKRREYLKFYRQLEQKFEIISPDVFLRPYLEKYYLFAGIFRVIKANFRSEWQIILEKLRKKTEKLVKEISKTKGLVETLPVYPINERAIALIHADSSPETVKIIKIHKSIADLIDTEGVNQPFLFSLREKLEKIIEDFESKQCSTKEALARLESLIGEINSARNEKKKLGLNEKQFGYYWILKEDGLKEKEDSKEIAEKIFDLTKEHSNWMYNNLENRALKRKLIAFLLPRVQKSNQSLKYMNKILEMERMAKR